MILSWFRRRRRKRLLATPTSEGWFPWLDAMPFYSRLPLAAREQIVSATRIMVSEKHWEGCGGLRLTEKMQVVIASQAALLLVGIKHDYFRQVRSVFVYPSAYKSPAERVDSQGHHAPSSARLGEAWYRGPVVLAWDAVERGVIHPRDGRNVVIHEFAHKLDFLDGSGDGTPPLASPQAYASWREVMTSHYEMLVSATAKGRVTLLDDYGTTNAAEFFAVASECFFEQSAALANRHPQLYDVLKQYYGQDPAGGSESES